MARFTVTLSDGLRDIVRASGEKELRGQSAQIEMLLWKALKSEGYGPFPTEKRSARKRPAAGDK